MILPQRHGGTEGFLILPQRHGGTKGFLILPQRHEDTKGVILPLSHEGTKVFFVSSCLRGTHSPGIFIEDLVLAIFSAMGYTQFRVFFGDFDWW